MFIIDEKNYGKNLSKSIEFTDNFQHQHWCPSTTDNRKSDFNSASWNTEIDKIFTSKQGNCIFVNFFCLCYSFCVTSIIIIYTPSQNIFTKPSLQSRTIIIIKKTALSILTRIVLDSALFSKDCSVSKIEIR